MSTSYNGFAYLYDQFMDNIPYAEWSDYLCSLLRDYGISSGRLVELGCGTATLANYMSLAGYDVIGIDNSIDMLTIAADKTAGNPPFNYCNRTCGNSIRVIILTLQSIVYVTV